MTWRGGCQGKKGPSNTLPWLRLRAKGCNLLGSCSRGRKRRDVSPRLAAATLLVAPRRYTPAIRLRFWGKLRGTLCFWDTVLHRRPRSRFGIPVTFRQALRQETLKRPKGPSGKSINALNHGGRLVASREQCETESGAVTFARQAENYPPWRA